MLEHTIIRSFDHKTCGHIGAVEFTFPLDGWFIGDKALNPLSVIAMANQSLQIFQDAYAGIGSSKTESEGRAAFDAKVDKIENNNVGVTRGSEPAENKYIRQGILSALVDAEHVKYSAIEGESKSDDRKTFLMDAYDNLAADSNERAKIDEYARLMVQVDKDKVIAAESAKSALKGVTLHVGVVDITDES